jgi:FtsH-binding integral membrane protein
MTEVVEAEKLKQIIGVYTALVGMSLATLGLIYTGASIARTFFVCSAMFGGMSLYGYTTKKDLTSMGSFLYMELMGLSTCLSCYFSYFLWVIRVLTEGQNRKYRSRTSRN